MSVKQLIAKAPPVLLIAFALAPAAPAHRCSHVIYGEVLHVKKMADLCQPFSS